MALVENFEDEGSVRIGIGSEDEAALLYAEGVEHVKPPSEIQLVLDMRAFRGGDTLIFVRPKALSTKRYLELNRVSDGEGLFQVVGHEPVTITTTEEATAFRALQAKVGRSAPVQEATGRKPGIQYTLEQAEAILRYYWQVPRKTPDEVCEFVEKLLKIEAGSLEFHWVKMLCRKYTGTTVRTMPSDWDGLGEKEPKS